MSTPVIGLSKHKFKINNKNTFRVYGENFNDTTVVLKAELKSSNFDWDPPDYTVAASDRKQHYVVLTSKPNPKGAPAPTARAPHFTSDTDDDLTITLTFDDPSPGSPDAVTVSEDYTVTFEDP